MTSPQPCARCELYAKVRGQRIRAEIARTSTNGTQATDRWARFMAGVHARHAPGMTLGRIAAVMALANNPEEAPRP